MIREGREQDETAFTLRSFRHAEPTQNRFWRESLEGASRKKWTRNGRRTVAERS
jgi:hypothetical protein